ncbi:hypothetical protein [Leptospira weilii]|uniref:hypothetical protein n=1 Tax=Leptospira weilii TaxID=28184 RepID=UPI0035E3F827
MKDAVKAYVKDETTNAISKATGIPAWMISNQMEKMNKPKEQWYQSQEFQMVTTVVAVAAAPFTGGASLMVMMAVGAGIGAATGAASGGLKGALIGAVGGAAGAAVKSFTGGAVNVGLSYSAENGFGASVGVGYGPATVSVGISERGGTSVDVGFNKAGFNAGLSYNSKTGSVSGSAGFTSQSSGTGFALSYSEGDGFGASLSKSFSNGLNGGLSWSEKGGVGGNIGYEAPGDKDKPKNSLANQMKGAGGTLSFSQRDGLSAALNASGGVNAGNWSQSGGFQANTNYLMDSWKADFVSKQGELEELQSKGLSKEQATAILDAQAHAESKAAQEKNNQESGKSVLDGAGYAATRKEGEDVSFEHLSENDRNNLNKEIDHLQGQYDKLKGVELAGLGTSSLPEKAALDKLTRVGNEVSAYLDFKEGKISKAEFDKRVGEAKSTYANNTQGERDKIPLNTKKDPGKYTDVSRENLKGLTHLEDSKGVIGRIVKDGDGNMYFRTEALGKDSKSIPMEPTKITEKPFTKIDPHDQAKYPGSVDLHAPYGSPMTVMKSDDGKFQVTKLKAMSEGGNSLTLKYKLGGVTREVDLRHAQNQFPSYVIDQLKARPNTPLTFDNGTIVGWTGVTGQHGIGNDGKIKWDTTDHTHAEFKNSNATQWKDWGLKAMGF